MGYPEPRSLTLPLERHTAGDLQFGQTIRRRLLLWATHLGDDLIAEAGTPVKAIGDGEVVMAQTLLGSAEVRNWGGLVVLAHHHRGATDTADEGNFFSIYGHLKDLQVTVGEVVSGGAELGVVAPGYSPENGWWQQAHLHFAIYSGPWQGKVLPGYFRPDAWLTGRARTKLSWWHNPQEFIAAYSNSLAS